MIMVLSYNMDKLMSRQMILLLLFVVQSVMPYIIPRHSYDNSEGLESALQLLERNRLNNNEDNTLQDTLAGIEENKLQQIIREILEEEQENPDETPIGSDDDFNENSDENSSEDDETELLNRLGLLEKRGGPRFYLRKPSLLSRILEEDNTDNVPVRFSHRKPGRFSKRYIENDMDDYLDFDKRFAHRKPYRQGYYRRKFQPRKRDTFDLLQGDDELDFEKKYSHRKPYRFSRPKPRLYKRDLQNFTPEEDTSDIEEEKKWAHRKPFRKVNFLRSNKRDFEDYDLDEMDDFEKRYSHRKPGSRKHAYRTGKREYDYDDGDVFEEDKRFSHRKPSKLRYFSKSLNRQKKMYDDSSDENEGNETPSGEPYREWMIQNYLQSLTPQPMGNDNAGDKTTDAGESNNDANNNINNSNNKQATDSNKETVPSTEEKIPETGTMENKVRTVEDAVLRDAMGMIEDAKAHGYTTDNDPNAQREFARMVAAYRLDKLRQSMTSGIEKKKIKRNIPESITNDGKAHEM